MDIGKSNERRHRHRKTGGRKRSSRPDEENTESQCVSTTTSSQSEGKSDSSNSAGGSSIEIPKSDEDLTSQRWETRPTPPIELCTPSHSASVISNSVQTPLSEPPDRLSQETPLLDTQSTPTISKTEAETERKVKRKRKKFGSSHHSSDSGGNSPPSHTNPSSSADELSTCVTESEMCDIYKDSYYNPIHLPLSNELYTPAYCVHVTDTCDVDKDIEQSLAVAYQTGTHVHNEDIPNTQAEDGNRSKSVDVDEDNIHKDKIDLRLHEVEQPHNIGKQVAGRLNVTKEELPERSLNIPQNNASICETILNVEASPIEVRVQDDTHKKPLQEIETIPESLKQSDLTTKLEGTSEDKSTHRWKKKFGWPKGNLEFGKGNYDTANALRTYDDNTQKEVQLVRVYKMEDSNEKEETEFDRKGPEIENEMPRQAKKNAEINDLAVVSVKAPKFGIRFDKKKKKINDTQSENGSTANKNQGGQSPYEKPNTQPKTFRFNIGEKLKIGSHKTKSTDDLSLNQMLHATTEATDVRNEIEEPQIKMPEGKEIKLGPEINRLKKEYNAFASDQIQNTLAGNAKDEPNDTTELMEAIEEDITEKQKEHRATKEKRVEEIKQRKNINEAFKIKEILAQINEPNQEHKEEKQVNQQQSKNNQRYENIFKNKHGNNKQKIQEKSTFQREKASESGEVQLPSAEVSVPSKKFGFGFGFGGKGKKGSLKVKKPKVSGEAGVDLSAGANVRAPEFGAEARLPGVDGSLDVDVGLPKVQVDASAPSVHVRGPELQIPEVGVDVGLGGAGDVDGGGQIAAPGVSLKAPKFGFKFGKKDKKAKVAVPSVGTPDVGVSGDVQLPSAEVSVPSKKFGFGFGFGGKGKKGSLKVKKPKVSGEAGVDLSAGANVRAPDVDVDLHAGGDAKSGGLKFPKISMPTFKLGASHPHADVDVSLPDASVSVSGPTVDLPSLKAEVDVPDVDLRLPDVSTTGDLSAQVGLDGVPSAEFGADLKLPDVAVSGDVSAPSIGADVRLPDVGGSVDVIVPPSDLVSNFVCNSTDPADVSSGICAPSHFASVGSSSISSSGNLILPVNHITSDSFLRARHLTHSDGIPGDVSSSPPRLSLNAIAGDMEVFDSTDVELRPLNFTFDHGDSVGSVGGNLELSPAKTSPSRHPRSNFSLSRLFGSLHRRKRKTPGKHQGVVAPEDPVHRKAVVSKVSEKLLAGQNLKHVDDTSVEATKTPYSNSTPMQRSSLPKSRDSLIRQTWHGDDDRLNLSQEAGHFAGSDEAPQLPPTPTGVRIKPVLKDPGNLFEVRRRGTADLSKPRPWSTLECPPLGCVFVNDDYLFPDALTPTKIPSFRGSKDAVYNVPYMDDKAIPSEEPEWPIGESRRTLLSQLSQNSGSLARIAAEESSIISLDDKENRYHHTEGRSRAGRLFGKKKKTSSRSKQDEKSDKGARSTSGSRSSGRFATWRSRQGRVHQ